MQGTYIKIKKPTLFSQFAPSLLLVEHFSDCLGTPDTNVMVPLPEEKRVIKCLLFTVECCSVSSADMYRCVSKRAVSASVRSSATVTPIRRPTAPSASHPHAQASSLSRRLLQLRLRRRQRPSAGRIHQPRRHQKRLLFIR